MKTALFSFEWDLVPIRADFGLFVLLAARSYKHRTHLYCDSSGC